MYTFNFPGPDLLLSDVILYPHFYLISEFCDKGSFKALCPKSYAWFQRVSSQESQPSCKEVIALPCPPTVSKMNLKLKWPKEEVPNYSLYKSDPKRVNPSARIFTRQPDIDRAMEAISEAASIEVRYKRLYYPLAYNQQVGFLLINVPMVNFTCLKITKKFQKKNTVFFCSLIDQLFEKQEEKAKIVSED